MSKRILGLLLVVCLVVGLLPVVASAATPADATLKFGWTSLALTDYDTPVYTKNVEKTDSKDTAGNVFTTWGQTTSGATEENYNAKYEWKTGEDGPTLTLRGFKLDEWNNETETMLAKIVDGEYSTNQIQTYAITTASSVPTKIILTGDDSLIEAQFGITYKNNLTIESDGNTKLKLFGRSSCISSNETAEAALTLNANLDLTLGYYYGTKYNAAVIQTYKADLTVNGGTIKMKILQEEAKTPAGLAARGGGNVVINGGTITAVSITGAGPTNGCIYANAGKLIFNGGTTNVKPKNAVGLYAKLGMEFNGGTVNVTSSYYGVNVGTTDEPATIEFKGGTLNVMAMYSFYSGTVINAGDGVMFYVGPNEKDAEIYDGSEVKLLQKPWARITNDPELFIEVTEPPTLPPIPTTAPTTAPTQMPTGVAPTTLPTQAPTTLPTQASTVGTGANTDDAAGNNNETQAPAADGATQATNNTTKATEAAKDNGSAKGNGSTTTTGTDAGNESDDSTLLIVAAAVIVVAAAAVVVIIIKRKKA